MILKQTSNQVQDQLKVVTILTSSLKLLTICLPSIFDFRQRLLVQLVQ